MQIALVILVILTMVPQLVPALPVPMVNRVENSQISKNDVQSLVNYLVTYGHLKNRRNVQNLHLIRTFPPYSEEEIENGIKSFQTSFGLTITGQLDEKTMNVMKSPRCGIPDKVESTSNSPIKVVIRDRRRRYAIQGGKWHKSSIKWTIYRYYQSNSLSVGKQRKIFDKAFKIWEYSSPLKFTHTSDMNQADTVVQFVSGNHGCQYDFDGKSGVLAHAFFPNNGGDIHFDADEWWEVDVSLLNVAVHEIGHTLGLSHSNIYDSIMYGTYRPRNSIALDIDDKAGINAIYGPCETKLDGATSTWKTTYFFRGELVWKVDNYDSHVMPGYPKKIVDEFSSQAPTSVDTTLLWSDGKMYFLKSSRSVGYDMTLKSVKYNDLISVDWPGIPDNLDACVAYKDDSVTYFFKGDEYWKFDDFNFQVESGYPKKISTGWPGVPNDLDAAFHSEWFGKTYFFKGTEYWVFSVQNNHAYSAGSIRYKWENVCSAKY